MPCSSASCTRPSRRTTAAATAAGLRNTHQIPRPDLACPGRDQRRTPFFPIQPPPRRRGRVRHPDRDHPRPARQPDNGVPGRRGDTGRRRPDLTRQRGFEPATSGLWFQRGRRRPGKSASTQPSTCCGGAPRPTRAQPAARRRGVSWAKICGQFGAVNGLPVASWPLRGSAPGPSRSAIDSPFRPTCTWWPADASPKRGMFPYTVS